MHDRAPKTLDRRRWIAYAEHQVQQAGSGATSHLKMWKLKGGQLRPYLCRDQLLVVEAHHGQIVGNT